MDNTTKQQFKDHCGERYDKFMNYLQTDDTGKLRLFYWQEKLIESFLKLHPDLDNDLIPFADAFRDGSEMMYGCPVDVCWGIVSCLDYKIDLWGCGECGTQWESSKTLLNQIKKNKT